MDKIVEVAPKRASAGESLSMYRTLLLTLVVLLGGVLPPGRFLQAQEGKTPIGARPAYRGYMNQKIQGFNLYINKEVYRNNDDKLWKRKPLDVLDLELSTICRRLPDVTVKLLQKINIWVEWEDSDDPDLAKGVVAKYYGVQGNTTLWSLNKHKHPKKANNIEIINMRSLTREHQPNVRLHRCVLLHELSHAVHHQLFGPKNALIRTAYQQAMNRGLYSEARFASGRIRKPAYASKNDREYFAELSCAYMDKLHYYPFTPEELKEYDPQGYRLMEILWGKRKDLENALKQKTEKAAGKLLVSARQLYMTGKKKEGVEELGKILDNYPETKAGVEARKLRDEWAERVTQEK